jgi:hypothetical protein
MRFRADTHYNNSNTNPNPPESCDAPSSVVSETRKTRRMCNVSITCTSVRSGARRTKGCKAVTVWRESSDTSEVTFRITVHVRLAQ